LGHIWCFGLDVCHIICIRHEYTQKNTPCGLQLAIVDILLYLVGFLFAFLEDLATFSELTISNPPKITHCCLLLTAFDKPLGKDILIRADAESI
jgi:hypothetical protein